MKKLSALLALVLAASAFALAQPPASSAPQQVETAGTETEVILRWEARPRVRRYRVQVASDANFSDIVFDGAVVGLEQKVTGLAPGKYFWRVAPAPRETGRFSRGEPVEVTAGRTVIAGAQPSPRPTVPAAAAPTPRTRNAASTTAMTNNAAATAATAPLRSPRDVGWQAAIGRVQRPVPARLRAGQTAPDLVAVNADGTVYALEGMTGVPLWTARFRSARAAAGGGAAQESVAEAFTPLVHTRKDQASNVVAAFDGGLRMLEGETGRELWRAILMGRPVSGSVAELGGDEASPEVAVVTEEPANLYVLEGTTGRVVSQTKLESKVIGLPVPFMSGADRGVALALENGQLEIRKRDGGRLRGIRFDVPFTTPPLVVTGPQGALVVIGTEHGLLFLNGAQLAPLGRITTENDAPRGRLTAADIDGDRVLEVAMVTRRGRVAVISAAGKINWAVDGGSDAYSAVFADLDRDGTLDILVADEGVFARGLSGRDGRLVWLVDEEPKTKPAAADAGRRRPLRTLAVTAGADGSPLVVSGDLSRSALRAVGLPAAPARAAAK